MIALVEIVRKFIEIFLQLAYKFIESSIKGTLTEQMYGLEIVGICSISFRIGQGYKREGTVRSDAT